MFLLVSSTFIIRGADAAVSFTLLLTLLKILIFIMIPQPHIRECSGESFQYVTSYLNENSFHSVRKKFKSLLILNMVTMGFTPFLDKIS